MNLNKHENKVAVFAVGVVLVVGEVKLAILLLCETADVSSDVEL